MTDPKQDLAALIYSEFGMERAEAGRIAEFVSAAGWVSPEEAEAREAAARREALLEAKRTMCAECASRVDEQEER